MRHLIQTLMFYTINTGLLTMYVRSSIGAIECFTDFFPQDLVSSYCVYGILSLCLGIFEENADISTEQFNFVNNSLMFAGMVELISKRTPRVYNAIIALTLGHSVR